MSNGNDRSIKRKSGRRREANLWKSDAKRLEERARKTTAVLEVAVEMFLERGSHRVSMNEIAEELGITKPALYNYFRSKDDILFECYRQGNAFIVAELDAIEASSWDGHSRLCAFIRAYVRLIAETYGSVMVRLDDRELPKDLRTEVRAFKRDIDARVRAIIESAVADGSIRSCNVRLTTFAIMGALNWIGQWFDERGDEAIDVVGDEFVLLLTEGLN